MEICLWVTLFLLKRLKSNSKEYNMLYPHIHWLVGTDAMAKIDRWIASVEKSDLSCFNTFIKTLIKYKFGIMNYFKSRKSSGFVEGLNNKIKENYRKSLKNPR